MSAPTDVDLDTQTPDAPHVAPGPRPRGVRLRLATVGVAAIGLLGVLAASGLGDSLVYYKTPTELAQTPALDGHRVRLGGLVRTGTVVKTPGGIAFTLTDGVTDVRVVNTGTPAGVFQAGQGALVEGQAGPDGVFRSDTLIVKHSNEYSSKRDHPGEATVQGH